MGRSAALGVDTVWPASSDPKTLICVRAQCPVAELFDTLFVASELQEQLHKQRGDTDLVEHPWVASKEEVPQEQYTWEPAGAPNQPSATLRYRKVRFKSPPAALASKPFQNEELQVLTQMVPGQLYVVEAVSSTSAPYGDKFTVFFRYTLRADGPGGSAGSATTSTLHLVFHVEFLPSMSRMMKPVVSPAVDAGVRGTFKIYRAVLGSLRSVADIKESELPSGPLPPAAAEEAAVEEAAEEAAPPPPPTLPPPHEAAREKPHVAAAPPSYHAPGGMPGLVSVLTQQLVVKEQVVLLADLVGAGLRSVTHSDGGAQLLAALLTVWLISIAVALLRGWQAACAPLAGRGGAGGGLAAALRLPFCWPLRLVDVPDSTTEVLASLALVAGINLAIIRGSEAAVRYLSRAHPGFMDSIRGYGAGGAAGGGVPGDDGSVVGGVAFGQVAVEAAAASAACAAAAGPGRRGSGGGAGGSAATGTAGSAAAAGAHGQGGNKGKAAASGGAGAGAGGGLMAAAAAAGAAAAAAIKPPAGKPKPLRAAPAPKQFTAAQLRQLELGQLSSAATKGGAAAAAAAPSPAAPPAARPAAPAAPAPSAEPMPAAATMTDAWAADLPMSMIARVDQPAATTTAAVAPPPPATSPRVSAAAAAANGRGTMSGTPVTPPGAKAPDGGSGGAAAAPAIGGGVTSPVQPSAKTLASSPGPTAAAVPSAATPSPPPASATGSFANMFTKEGMDSMAETLRSAFRWDAPKPSEPEAAGVALTSTASTTHAAAAADRPISPAGSNAPHAKFTKARSEAGIGGPGAAADGSSLNPHPHPHPHAQPPHSQSQHAQHYAVLHSTSARSLGGAIGIAGGPHLAAAATPHSLYSARSDSPLLGGSEGSGGGDDDDGASWVVEEVFENERFQPFRGWGHMWPGHFLPSDRVGHWSDRQGKPGGSASMVFDQVVPHLPRGWRWVEDEWQIDLDGMDQEAVDSDGWTYALDFYLLKYPPPPQSGKCSMKHFVRRRRYFRTRVRSSERALLSSVGEEEDGEHGWDGKESPSVASGSDEAAAAAAAASAGEDGAPGASTAEEGLPASTHAEDDAGRRADGGAVGAAESEDDGAAPRTVSAPVSAVPPRPSSDVGDPSVAAAGGAMPRPRSEAEALGTLVGARREGDAGPGAAPPSVAVAAPVAATLALLSTAPSDPFPAAGAQTRGGGAYRDRAVMSAAAVAAAPAQVAAVLTGSGRPATAGDAGGGGGCTRSSGEDFVLSPKTMVTSADPLGAFAEDQRTGAGLLTDAYSDEAFGSWKGARPAVTMGPAAVATPADAVAVQPALAPAAPAAPRSPPADAATFAAAEAEAEAVAAEGNPPSAAAAAAAMSPPAVVSARTAEVPEEQATGGGEAPTGVSGSGRNSPAAMRPRGLSSAQKSHMRAAGAATGSATTLSQLASTQALSRSPAEAEAGLPEGPVVAADLVEGPDAH